MLPGGRGDVFQDACLVNLRVQKVFVFRIKLDRERKQILTCCTQSWSPDSLNKHNETTNLSIIFDKNTDIYYTITNL